MLLRLPQQALDHALFGSLTSMRMADSNLILASKPTYPMLTNISWKKETCYLRELGASVAATAIPLQMETVFLQGTSSASGWILGSSSLATFGIMRARPNIECG